ncbi:DUF2510 domain-containing protein [Cellulomonas massiliensis]|uniref:DUF2510 domain-containing protein n=1 Tax=Cellulomonas massiliensis TaxID=1465811 RepID=UPI0002F06D1A|nr:DUF2510 domain-containing protein [Cellulomonas massiliensis]
MPAPQADWYPDPLEPARLRYWDGAQWTGYVVDRDRPAAVRYEHPPWLRTTTATGIDVPLSIAVTSAF